MADPYTKQVTYTFDVYGGTWAVLAHSPGYLNIEDTRKNGQEDCHMWGELMLNGDGKWELDESGREQIEMYSSSETADAIEAFFNEHGPPKEEKDG